MKIFYCLIFLCFGFSLIENLSSSSLVLQKKFDFDLVNFRITWTRTDCLFPGRYICEIGDEVTTWTIHGLWPSNSNGSHPFYCDPNNPFNTRSLEYLKPLLRKYWPNSYKNESEDSFWRHEWDKHGTCALGLPDIYTQNDYFVKGLEFLRNINVDKHLENHDILPDDIRTYNLTDIGNALKGYTDKRPFLYCMKPKKRDRGQFIYEIQFCHDKLYTPLNCGAKNSMPVDDELEKTFVVNASDYTNGLCDEYLPVIYLPLR